MLNAGVLILVFFMSVMLLMQSNSSVAMEECQVKHSYETCFYMLNR